MTVAIGFFDGVHLGHQKILNGADLALTFKNHPLSFLAPERAPRLIMSWEERFHEIQKLGVGVTALEFDAKIANLSPAQFLERLKTYKTPLRIRAGENWRFGKGGVGDAAFARACGFEVEIVPYAVYNDKPISSTRIRAALEAGKIEEANAMLGRRFVVEGEVFKGKGAGHKLGVPTINLLLRSIDKVKLPHGVYEVAFQRAKAIANYGLAPTFAEKAWPEPIWEIHVVGKALEGLESLSALASFEVVRYLRPERKFDSLDDLKRQIAADCAIIQA